MISEQVLYAIQAAGQQQTAQSFTGVGKAIAASGDQLDVYSKKSQKAASLLTALSGAVSGISPQFAALGAGAGRAAPAIEALTGLIGGGVGAAVAGGLIGAIGLASAAWKLYGDAQDVARASAGDLNVTLESQLELISKLDRSANMSSAVAQGLAGPEAQFAEVRRLEAERDRIRGRMNQLRSDDDKFKLADDGASRSAETALERMARGDFGPAPDQDGRAGRARREFERLAARDAQNAAALEKARAMRAQSLAEEGEYYTSGEDEGEDKKRGEAKLSENEKRIAALRALEEKNFAEGSQRMLELDRAALVIREQQRKSALDIEVDQEKVAAKTRETLRKESLAQQNRDEQYAYEERNRLDQALNEQQARRAEATGSAMRSMYEETTSVISGNFAGMAASIARGEKVTAKAVLTSIGSEIVGRGTGNLLDALFRAANPITAVATNAAGQIPMALAQIAFGASLAGTGAAMSGGGGGGGGARAASPTMIAPSTDSGAKNAQVMIINQYPAVVSPNAEDGKRVDRAKFEKALQGR